MGIIENCTPTDAEQLASIHASACGDRAWSLQMLQEALTAPACCGLKISHADRPLGFCLCLQTQDEAEIVTFAIHADCQRLGYGRQLLQSLCLRAKETGALRIFLEVAENNLGAQRLYGGFGFKRIGTRPNYYPATAESPPLNALLLRLEMV
jgi:[ribosomal protein S18]-alanine N-acetyltransferase